MKEIIGFKNKSVNDDSVCPNCGWELNIPVREIETTWLSYRVCDNYTCSRCNLQWKVPKTGV